MRYERVKVRRDTQTTHNRAVPPWEIPLLEFIFEEGNVEPLGEFEEVTDRDYPDPAEEYDRLVARYKKDSETKLEVVRAVYGQGRLGIKALARAIEEAREADGDAEVEMANRRKRRQAVNLRRFEQDPLLA
jgi:hypothetical protein